MQPQGQPCLGTRPDLHPLLQIVDYIGKIQRKHFKDINTILDWTIYQ